MRIQDRASAHSDKKLYKVQHVGHAGLPQILRDKTRSKCQLNTDKITSPARNIQYVALAAETRVEMLSLAFKRRPEIKAGWIKLHRAIGVKVRGARRCRWSWEWKGTGWGFSTENWTDLHTALCVIHLNQNNLWVTVAPAAELSSIYHQVGGLIPRRLRVKVSSLNSQMLWAWAMMMI